MKILLVAGLLLLWLSYSLLQTLYVMGRISPAWNALLAFLPGLLGLVGLGLARARSPQSAPRSFLHPAPLSRAGLAVLALSLLVELPILMTGRWVGWPRSCFPGGLAAGAGMAAQRAPVDGFAGPLHPVRVMAQRSGFHGRTAGHCTGGDGVPFLAGLCWAWQVQRDGTLWWVVILHSLILMVNSFFTWG